MNTAQEQELRFRLLKILEKEPNLSQREMARRIGISLGKINYCLSELAKRGFIEMNRFGESRNKVRYIYLLTPHGLEEKARLAMGFLKRKRREYEEIRQQIHELIQEIGSGELPLGPDQETWHRIL